MKKSIWLAYLKSRRRVIIAFCLFSAFYGLIFFLYDVRGEAFWYPTLLTVILALFFGMADLSRFSGRHKALCLALKTLEGGGLDPLPEPDNPTEADYQALIEALSRRLHTITSQTEAELKDRNDYYTLWAHQIKTPLAAMRLLLQSHEPDGLRAELEQQLFQVEQYTEMALQYLRLQNLSGDLELQKYPLSAIVKKAVKKYSVVFIHQKIPVTIEPIEAEVLTDERWLTFVVEQILSNALKYTREGQITIGMDKDAPQTLVIADTGIGIRAEDIPRIFERGFTGYNGRVDHRSTGIGLYLCRQVLDKLSHSISITSKVGAGTTVRIGLECETIEIE